jgi:hypothetical protein
MPDLLILAIIFSIAFFLFAIAIGSNLFVVMVDEQIRYLQLIVTYAPLPRSAITRSYPDPVSRYITWAAGNRNDPAGCAHIRYSGRIRFGKTGRWMKTGGKALFSLAVPGFIWHATITYAPGVWIETFDYYVHRKAGMNFNLFSFFPLNNAHDRDILTTSLFRYLASAPLFPKVLSSSDSITWENLDDSAALAVIHDGDVSAEAVIRFNGKGWIESIAIRDPPSLKHGLKGPGVFTCRFSEYAEAGGCHIPMQVFSEQILPDGQYLCMEYRVTTAEYDMPKTADSEIP